MEEVRTLNKRGQVVDIVTFNGQEFRRYPAGKHPNYYFSVTQQNGKQSHKRLHHAIWEFYNGREVPKGMDIHHIDGNALNNDISNLQLLTKAEHAKTHGFLRKNGFSTRDNASKVWYTKENWQERRSVAIQRLQSHPKVCQWCGKEFIATNVHQRFCSSTCHHQWQYKAPENLVEFTCAFCGKTFRGNKYLKPKCCSEGCAHRYAGYKHHHPDWHR